MSAFKSADLAAVPAGETIQAGDSVRNQFMEAVYSQISTNLQGGGVAQGSNFWNLYTVGVGSDDPYQITLADTSTMAVVAAQVRLLPAICHALNTHVVGFVLPHIACRTCRVHCQSLPSVDCIRHLSVLVFRCIELSALLMRWKGPGI